jgi:predicted amidohydrolase
MIYGNRTGFEDGVGFWGGSEIVGPTGERIAKAKYYDEDLVLGDVTLELIRRKRTMAPLLRDEDIDLTINELMRIRERPSPTKKDQVMKGLRIKRKKKIKRQEKK